MALGNVRTLNAGGIVWLTVLAASSMVAGARLDAHKAVTSQYTYNEDVFPILRDKCGRCHIDGGAAPMSLLTYKGGTRGGGGAFAWAESMREMLTSEAMPPWYADPTGPPVKNHHVLTARELDVLVTWASGGTPEGDLNHKPVAPSAHFTWSLGKPDLELPLPEPQVLSPGEMERTVDLILPTNFTETKWVKAADLLPGTPSMVRRATVSVENGPVLSVWEPAHDPSATPSGTAFRIPAGAKLRVQVYYKKPWQEEQRSKSDQSVVGLYFTDPPLSGKEISALMVDGGGEGQSSTPRNVTGTMTRGGRVLAIRPSLDQPYVSVDIDAIAPSGKHVPLLKLRAPRPEWPRRYWLTDPVELPAGTTIQVRAIPGDPDSGPLMKAVPHRLEFGFEVVWQ